MQFHNSMPTVSLSYHQAISQALSLGCEGQLNVMMMMSVLSGGFRYSHKDYILTGQVSTQPMSSMGGQVTFLRKVDSRPGSQICYGTQLKVVPDIKSPQTFKTEWSVGWDYKLQMSSVKGNIDSNGRIHALIEQRINPFMTMIVSGMADFWNSKYLFGVGLQVVLQELTEEQQKMLMEEEKRIQSQSKKKSIGETKAD